LGLQLSPMNPDTPKLDAQYQTVLVLWFALLISQLLFVLLVFFIKPELLHLDATKPVLGSQPFLVIVLAAASLLTLVLSFVMEKGCSTSRSSSKVSRWFSRL
jgi:hypothetical protein